MNIILFFSIFSMFIALYTFLGVFVSKKITTMTDYFLAGKNLGIPSVMFTLIATQIGGGMLLGTTQEAYSIGLYGLMYSLGMSIGFLALASGIAAKLQSLQVATTAELFTTKYNAPKLQKVASLLSILTMSGLLVGQIVGAKTLLNGLGFMNEPLFIAFWGFTIFYTMVGGLKAVVVTDIFQVLFILILFVGIFVYSIYLDPSSVITIFRSQKYFYAPHLTTTSLFATLLMPALFSLIEQDLAQRFFAARTKRVATVAAFGSALCLLAFALVPIYFGMYAQYNGIIVPSDTSPLIPILQTLLPDIVVILGICAIMAAIVSTADSLLCAISSNIAYGFDIQFAGNTPITRSRNITLFVGTIALVTSYFVPANIISILIDSYEISVGCLLIPLLACYFLPQVKKGAAIAAVSGGIIGLILFRLWTPPIPKELATIILSAIGYVIGWIISSDN